ncbi:putative maltose permease protein [Rutstroemia sp. NJR-2017a BBW]|nr:putative maltose permease protein [Rutstroemia sp. NJR-2017a BBW]
MSEPLKRSKPDPQISSTPAPSSLAPSSPEPRELDADAPLTTTTTKSPLSSHPTSIAWSLFFSIGIILTGVNAQTIGGLFATPAFQRDFGYLYDDSYIISAPWQSGIIVCLPLGMFFGACSVGYFMDKYGRKIAFLIAATISATFIFFQFFARSLTVLLLGELIAGLVGGMFLALVPTYVSEICPPELRGYMTSSINLALVVGDLIGNGIIAGTHQITNHWAYRLPLALQWVFPLIMISGGLFAPESPWWLVRKGRFEEAEKSLRRLAARGVDTKKVLREMRETDRLELEMQVGSTYKSIFNKLNIRRTEISLAVGFGAVLSGLYLGAWTSYFFELAGLPQSQAFNMSVVFTAVGVIGNLLSWPLSARVGRRRMYNGGIGVIAVLMFIVGILDCVPDYESRPDVIWGQSALLILFFGIYNLTVGPVSITISSEISATKIRTQTIAVAAAVQSLLGLVMTVAIPFMINPDQGGWGGKVGFFFGECL